MILLMLLTHSGLILLYDSSLRFILVPDVMSYLILTLREQNELQCVCFQGEKQTLWSVIYDQDKNDR